MYNYVKYTEGGKEESTAYQMQFVKDYCYNSTTLNITKVC